MTNQQLLASILALCHRHNTPGVNAGAHALAVEIIRMIEEGAE